MSHQTSPNCYQLQPEELASVGSSDEEELHPGIFGGNSPSIYHTPITNTDYLPQLIGVPNGPPASAHQLRSHYYGDFNRNFSAHPVSDGVIFGDSSRRTMAFSFDQNNPLASHGAHMDENQQLGFEVPESTDMLTNSSESPQHSSPSTASLPSIRVKCPRVHESLSHTYNEQDFKRATFTPASVGTVTSPIRMKRPRARESLSHTYNEQDFKRATFGPASVGTVTPESTSSFDLLNDPDLARILGGDPREHMADLIEDQRKQENLLEARRKQEAQDAEFARFLSREVEEELDHPPSSMSSNGAGPSSVHTSTRQTILSGPTGYHLPSLEPPITPDHRIRQPLPGSYNPSWTAPPIIPSNALRIALPNAPFPVPFTAPRAAPLNMTGNHHHNFIDLSSDDGDGSTAKKEELREIDRSDFRPNEKSVFRQPFMPYSADQVHLNRSGPQPVYGNFSGAGAYPGSSGQTPSRTDHIDLTQYDGYNARNAGPSPYSQYLKAAVNAILPSQRPSSFETSANRISSVASAAYGLVDQSIKSYPPINVGPMINIPKHPIPGRGLASQADPHDDYESGSATTSAELKALLENIRPEEGLDPRTRLGTPEAMTEDATLYEHQKLGLAWLISMENSSNKGGILADDMGLGKTIQAIALMVSRRSESADRKTTLIVAPVALMRQWESEIKNKIKPDRQYRLSIYLYHGSGTKTTWDHLKVHDVVLTTYGTLAAEYSRKLRIEELRKGNPDYIPGPQEKLPLLGNVSRFYRVILDEAQNIKNKSTKAARAAHSVQSLTRLCMTGTPMMNTVEELYSLINFLRIRPYSEFNEFNQDFTRPLKRASQKTRDNAMRKLQVLLKAILLRRTKKTTVDGKPIIELPERTTGTQRIVFDDEEAKVYRALETKSQLVLSRYLKEGTVMRNYSNVLVLLLRLRQACCHPHLMSDFAIAANQVTLSGEITAEDSTRVARGLLPAVVARLKESGVADCPICMDVTDNATIFDPCGHATCSECFAKISDPSDGRNEQTDSFKCPNCRGVVRSKVVTDWTTFRKVHLPDPSDAIEEEAGLDAMSDSDSDSDSDSETDGDDSDTSSLGGFLHDAEDGHESKETKSKKKVKGKERAGRDDKSKPSLAQLRKESRKNVAAKQRYLRRLKKDFVPSSKLTRVMELLEEIHERPPGEKTIVFSQFTSLLDLLEVPLSHKGWDYGRYDGSMSANARNDAVLDFTNRKRCTLMLVSLKAGNAGLNLTVASNVILLDPFWNPYIEEQAIDRCHRIGQRRPVQVHRLLVAQTVEDRIIELQEKKRALIEGALDEGASRSMGRLGVRELTYLFGLH